MQVCHLMLVVPAWRGNGRQGTRRRRDAQARVVKRRKARGSTKAQGGVTEKTEREKQGSAGRCRGEEHGEARRSIAEHGAARKSRKEQETRSGSRHFIHVDGSAVSLSFPTSKALLEGMISADGRAPLQRRSPENSKENIRGPFLQHKKRWESTSFALSTRWRGQDAFEKKKLETNLWMKRDWRGEIRLLYQHLLVWRVEVESTHEGSK